MNTRLSRNTNETLFTQPTFRGLPVMVHRGPLIERYLDKTYQTIESALAQYPRIFATRFDLALPEGSEGWASDVISRFIEYFKADIASYLKVRGMKADACRPRFIWAKERNRSDNYHYHVLLILNRDVFPRSGCILSDKPNTVGRIESAWANALGIPWSQSRGLVHFPKNRDYSVDLNSQEFLPQLVGLFHRTSYLAKEDTKAFEDGSRHFSCSLRPVLPSGFSLQAKVQEEKDRIEEMVASGSVYGEVSCTGGLGK